MDVMDVEVQKKRITYSLATKYLNWLSLKKKQKKKQ